MPIHPLRSRTSDERASRVEALLDQNESALIAYAARRLGGDVERARDVVQDAFLRLCREEDLEGRGREWLFRVTRNLCIDVHRKESRMSTLEEPETEVGTASVDTDASAPLEVAEDLALAIDRLPDRQQEAIRLKFESGLSYAEIGRVMETSAGTVGWLLHTAIQGLRARMAPEGGVR